MYIGWCIGKCPLYRGVLYSECPLSEGLISSPRQRECWQPTEVSAVHPVRGPVEPETSVSSSPLPEGGHHLSLHLVRGYRDAETSGATYLVGWVRS